MPEDKVYNVLFLCTGNSARSVMAESILNRLGKGRFQAYSAGSFPTGQINAYVRDLLERFNHPTEGLRSKSWDEFAGPDAPEMDFVFTVCDQAAGEVCPIWPGHPASAHWPFADPAKFAGTDAEIAAATAEVYGQIERRVSAFVNLPIASLDKLSLQKRLNELGESAPQPA